MPTRTIEQSTHWRAERRDETVPTDPCLSPRAVDESWIPLRQAWRPDGPEPGFNPGWARIQYSAAALHFDIIFLGPKPTNLAVGLNEHTWEMGDVSEIFLQSKVQERYLEIHVTPENQRLQLVWPTGGLARWRNGDARFEDFTVADPQWIQSFSRIGPGFWSIHADLPSSVLGVTSVLGLGDLRTAVCRYDCTANSPAILSSTAALPAPDYHRPLDWHRLQLARQGS